MNASASPLFVSRFGLDGALHTLLCIHGIESHGLRYIALAERLGAGVRVVAPDLRGHGRSLKVGPWTLEQHLEDLLPLLSETADLPVLLGHSYGGLLAWELARSAPESISALILADPAIGVSADLAEASVTYDYSSVGHSWPDHASVFADFVSARPPSGAWSAALDAATTVERGEDGLLRPVVAPDAVAAGWRQMSKPLRASSWNGPTLLIEAGREHGAFASPAVISAMRNQLGPRFQHIVLDVTHTIPSDHPDELAEAVSQFLDMSSERSPDRGVEPVHQASNDFESSGRLARVAQDDARCP
ncbi:MAG TPA: alpha/beta hydrolase [Candidatus Limnocylindrales bacterium]